MTTLSEFWPTIPSRSDEELKLYAVVMPTTEARDYLVGQDGIASSSVSKSSLLQLRNGNYVFCADLLLEFHPETATGLYGNKPQYDEEGNLIAGTGYDTVLDPIASTIQIEDWATTITDLPPDPVGDEAPLQWQAGYQAPGAIHPGYPRGSRVFLAADPDVFYTSLVDWNVWQPGAENGLTWEAPPAAPGDPWVQPTGAGDAYAIGDEVFHDPENGRPERYWRSKIPANTTRPGHDGSPGQWFDRWWEPIAEPGPGPDPGPKDWVQPVPGTTARPYMIGELAIYNGQTVRSTVNYNVWSPEPYPAGYGWEVVE